MKRPIGASVSNVLYLSCVSMLLLPATEINAACSLTPSAGNDSYVCDSGTSAGVTDLQGSNTLNFPAGGTGTINGDVQLGPAADQVLMDSGTIQGRLDMGDGANVLRIGAGTVTGAVQQGAGPDIFQMTGGSILSLSQGDTRDTFFMSGGTIVGAFEDGDVATMTGGTIGRVDMKLDNNIFDMSNGRIIGNLVTGLGRDIIIVSGGSIGGNVSVSGGNDNVTVTGGVISGEIRTSLGNDVFVWNGGGQINSAVLMGDGDDTARVANLTESQLAATPSLDGGLGADTLTFSNTASANPARYVGWETVNLNDGSRLDLGNGSLFLGDSASATGTFNIDGSSILTSTQGAVRPYQADQLATLNNAGVIDLTRGSSVAGDTFSVYGNYVGAGGQLWVKTVLGDDQSASDKLVVSQGSISGHTQLSVTNLGGLGGLTQSNGIEVVQALNGATSTTDAFALKGSLSAGAYQYYLFKGGVTAGTENNWYLRSSVAAVGLFSVPPSAPVAVVPPVTTPVAAAPPTVSADEPPVEAPTAAPVAPPDPPATSSTAQAATSPEPAATTPPVPQAVPGEAPIALYRLEVPVYSVIVPAAQMMTLSALGTFHERQGDQSLLAETGMVPAGWGRLYGDDLKKSWSGTASPRFDGSTHGYQIGHDLFASALDAGQTQRLGFFVGQSRLRGDVQGFAEGFQHRKAGHLKLEGDHVGAYWTLVDPSGWYLDAVAMGTRLNGTNRSDRGVKLDTDGHAVTLSLESGYPLPISEHWILEPQAQIIRQRIDLDKQNDGISDVAFDAQTYWTGRLGARLKGRYVVSGTPVEPYLRANAWHTFNGRDTVTYNGVDRIKSEHRASSANIGAGVVAKLSTSVSLYLAVDYSANLDSEVLEGSSGEVGVRVSW
ncbi:autotransporter outer membrane beta-barrel domain-containing protein [Pseudomonas sp. SLFW]|uniref:autotransporter family protein n=1 Tax=Pseudomonas sp. SLFW TaxID=2683259 RepID=UPI001412BCB6|nr:autotransporter outer membrane beta-barrel domain-containing protein [Pseudomonas sp. SLFW]NBB11984.1 autotransporter outer membrane beta-barrel domain-containing protein [Pseudomonas sp. SLFW]